MRIFTVTVSDQPVAVVRARSADDAIAMACELSGRDDRRDVFDAREPNDAEMVGWIERRDDYVVPIAA